MGMGQPDATAPVVAREVLWTYTGISEESVEKEFYSALEEQVAAELARRIPASERIWVGREKRLPVGSYMVQARLINIEPQLANLVGTTTKFLARYRVRAKDEGQDVSTFLAEVIRYPNERMEAVFSSLVGLDAVKADMVRKLNLLLRPEYLAQWMDGMYGEQAPLAIAQVIRERYPLFILEGQVGSGKTALARSVGSRVAKRLQQEIVLFIVNAQVRGGGHVGELTQNIVRAFNEVERCQEREQVPAIILIDEADTLAQMRGGSQTHHEDDAGVNTLIQRIDRLRGKPIAVIFATNMVHSLDAALLRRACATYHFDRPSAEQRSELFRRVLMNTGIDEQTIKQMVELTKPRCLLGLGNTPHRYTYSDLSQRIIPRAVEDAVYAQQPLKEKHLIAACEKILPTPEA